MGNVKRDQGQSTQVYILVEDTSNNFVGILEGQEGLSQNITNNLQEVTGFKKAGVSDEDNVVYVQRTDGTRDVTLSVTIGRPESAADRALQDLMLTKLKTKKNTSTTVFVGNTAPPTTGSAIADMTFTGSQYQMLIGAINTEYPNGSPVTGTIELSNEGSVAPIEHSAKKFSTIITEITGA